jgi:hypothetical protein
VTETGWNSVNTIFSPQARSRTKSNLDLLTAQQKKKVTMSKCNDLLDMGRLVLLDHGCWHLRIEFYYQYGKYLSVLATHSHYNCKVMCPNCRRSD